MRYASVLFDFDGTLADSEHVALEAINAVAPEFGFEPVLLEEFPKLRMLSAWQLLTQRAHIPLWNIPKVRRLQRRIREEIVKRADRVDLFPGIAQMLNDCRQAGCELGIVTSSSQDIVVAALERASIAVDFLHAGSNFFGKARAIKNTIRTYELERSHSVYVGDELRDVEACKAVGIDMIGVGWGFNAPEALFAAGAKVAATPQELFGMLTAHE